MKTLARHVHEAMVGVGLTGEIRRTYTNTCIIIERHAQAGCYYKILVRSVL
jgi:hypothetical protein